MFNAPMLGDRDEDDPLGWRAEVGLCINDRTGSFTSAMCASGQVLNRFDDFEEYGIFWAGCMEPLACLYAYERNAPELRDVGCVYADLTFASTGVIPPSEPCEEVRAAGLCSLECQCSDPRARCYGPSEARALGVCVGADISPDICSETYAVCRDFERCIVPTARPPWLGEAAWQPRDPPPPSVFGDDLVAGWCARADNCAALQARYPGVWDCL